MAGEVRLWLRRMLRDDSGMATVEAAYAIAAISAVLIMCLGGLGAMTSALRCTDAAREVARLTAAGDVRAREVGAAAGPSGARITVTRKGEQVAVLVEAEAPLLPLLAVSGRAVALMEPEEDEADEPRSSADGR